MTLAPQCLPHSYMETVTTTPIFLLRTASSNYENPTLSRIAVCLHMNSLLAPLPTTVIKPSSGASSSPASRFAPSETTITSSPPPIPPPARVLAAAAHGFVILILLGKETKLFYSGSSPSFAQQALPFPSALSSGSHCILPGAYEYYVRAAPISVTRQLFFFFS